MTVTTLENWIKEKKLNEEIINNLQIIRQTSDLLIMNKSSITNKDIFNQICPNLSIHQIIKIMKVYHKDSIDKIGIPQKVFDNLPSLNEDFNFNLDVTIQNVNFNQILGNLDLDLSGLEDFFKNDKFSKFHSWILKNNFFDFLFINDDDE
jgi:hypothetical protein